MGGYKNIKPKEAVPFKKGYDPRREGNGRKKKFVKQILEQFKKDGVQKVGKEEIVDCYMSLINLSIPELKKLVKDESLPALIRIVSKEILSGKGFDVIERLIDRAIGKPTNVNEHSGNIKIEQPLFPDTKKENDDQK